MLNIYHTELEIEQAESEFIWRLGHTEILFKKVNYHSLKFKIQELSRYYY